MTDLTFFNFSFLAFYYLNEYLLERKGWHLLLFFSFAVLATLTRQLGLALFLAYLMVEIIKNYKAPKRWITPLFLFAGGLMVLYAFELFESSRFRWDWSYQGVFFSPTKMPLSTEAIPRMYNKAFLIIKNSGLWLLLLFILTFPLLLKRIKKAHKFVLIIIPILFTVYLTANVNEHALGDVFINLGVGIESTVDMLMIYATDLHSTNNFVYAFLMILFCTGYFLFAFFVGASKWERIIKLSSAQHFIISIICLYLILIGIADSSFDRYCIFFGLFFIVYVMSNTLVYSKLSLKLSVIVFVAVFCFSVFATKDYFTAARLKKEIVNELAVKNKIIPERVSAGFEYQLWDRSDNQVNWINWDHLNDKICLITRRPVKEYEIFKTYTYQRFVPFKTDTFFVLKNQNNLETIYAIPGLGTTKELYRGISIPGYKIKALEWPEPKSNYTLKEYATKFLNQIDTTGPVNLMGVSFGGMLCSELAEQIKTKNVILISSCKDISEFPFLLKALRVLPIHKLFSDKLIRYLARSKRRILGFKKASDKLFFEMINEMPENYFPVCINYIVNWDKKVSQTNFIRIHGNADWLLPCSRVKQFNCVDKGSHIMILNQVNEINAILNKELNGL